MSETTAPEAEKSTSRALRFFSNPLIGIIGSIASTLGLFLAIYFYLDTKESPRLIYYVHPVKAILVKSGQASRLTTTFDGKPIEGDVTTAQVAIWNDGKRAIKRENILKPIVLYLESGARILEATIRKASRDVIHLEIDSSEFQQGRVPVSWNILEQNDGGIIQITYEGNTNALISIDGVVEGQRDIERLETSEKIATPEEQYNSAISRNRTSMWLGLILGLLMLFVAVLSYISRFSKWWVSFLMVLIAFFYLGGGLYFYLSSQPVGPSFGF